MGSSSSGLSDTIRRPLKNSSGWSREQWPRSRLATSEMIRDKLIDKGVGANHKFRWRSHEPSRIEGLSDAVFGFAVTLLVVSLEVPKTFGEMMHAMRGFGAFAISFVLLLVLWYTQYKFFRR